MSRIRAIFDAALKLEAGERMVIRCTSFKQMESVRSSLYRERMKWQDHTGGSTDIGVTRRSEGNKYLLILEKLEPFPDPVIISAEGEIKGTVSLAIPRADVPSLSEAEISFSSERTRMIRLMKEDGMSDQEIAEHFSKEEQNEPGDVRT